MHVWRSVVNSMKLLLSFLLYIGHQSLWQLTFYITCTGWALDFMVAHACNPGTWEAGAKQEAQEFKVILKYREWETTLGFLRPFSNIQINKQTTQNNPLDEINTHMPQESTHRYVVIQTSAAQPSCPLHFSFSNCFFSDGQYSFQVPL